MKKQNSLEDGLFKAGLILLAAGVPGAALYYGLILRKFHLPPCLFYTFLHVYCPGCGGTRAVGALLQGRFLESVWYHPLVLYTTIVFGGFMLTHGLERMGVRYIRGWKFHDWYLYGALVVLACNFLMKNLLWLVWGIAL